MSEAARDDAERTSEADAQVRRQQLIKFQQAQKLRQASAAMDLPDQPLVQTLAGGQNLMFAMARRMWVSPTTSTDGTAHRAVSSSSVRTAQNQRGSAAAIIWKNARKRNKPGMWRYAVRTFDGMTTADPPVQPITIHYEGALTACSKLGMWERALEMYHDVEEREAAIRQKLPSAAKEDRRLVIQVTDTMVMSLIRACVRACRNHSLARSDDDNVPVDHQTMVDQQRKPLDAMVVILQGLEQKHSLALQARHMNPIAAAYISLGLVSEASELLQTNLKDRTTGEECENGNNRLNVNDLAAKDKASYSLLVQGAVSDADWAGAVHALTNMTQAGLYPVSRHLNAWTEVSERKTKQRACRSWKKKRDECYLDSVR